MASARKLIEPDPAVPFREDENGGSITRGNRTGPRAGLLAQDGFAVAVSGRGKRRVPFPRQYKPQWDYDTFSDPIQRRVRGGFSPPSRRADC
jgi:hypothetical protein